MSLAQFYCPCHASHPHTWVQHAQCCCGSAYLGWGDGGAGTSLQSGKAVSSKMRGVSHSKVNNALVEEAELGLLYYKCHICCEGMVPSYLNSLQSNWKATSLGYSQSYSHSSNSHFFNLYSQRWVIKSVAGQYLGSHQAWPCWATGSSSLLGGPEST